MNSFSADDALPVLTLARLRALNAVMETGGFSAAARQLGLSQATVSQQIRDLERALSLDLFKRSANDMIPTPLCQQIYTLSRELEDTGRRIADLLTRHRNIEQGELRVGLGNAMPGMARIAAFQKLCPGVDVKIEMGSWTKIFAAVVEGRVDVAVLPEVPDEARFRRRQIQTQAVVAIVAPDHPLSRRTELCCADLMGERLIFRTPGSSTQRAVDDAFRSAGLCPKPSIVLDTRDGAMDAVASGLGVGFMWNRGSSRHDGFVQVPCREMRRARADHVFCLYAARGPLHEIFFNIEGNDSAPRRGVRAPTFSEV